MFIVSITVFVIMNSKYFKGYRLFTEVRVCLEYTLIMLSVILDIHVGRLTAAENESQVIFLLPCSSFLNSLREFSFFFPA